MRRSRLQLPLRSSPSSSSSQCDFSIPPSRATASGVLRNRRTTTMAKSRKTELLLARQASIGVALILHHFPTFLFPLARRIQWNGVSISLLSPVSLLLVPFVQVDSRRMASKWYKQVPLLLDIADVLGPTTESIANVDEPTEIVSYDVKEEILWYMLLSWNCR